MTAKEFKEWRLSQRGIKRRGKQHQGLSQQEAAAHLNVSASTIRRWEWGVNEIPHWVEPLIKA